MEKRRELQIEAGEAVTVTRLHQDENRWSGKFVDLSAGGMRIKLDSGLEIGSFLKLEVGGDLIVAEVCKSEQDGNEFCVSLLMLEWMEKSVLERLVREARAGSASLGQEVIQSAA